MILYQTVLYQAYLHPQYGWDADAGNILFESTIGPDPTQVMQELNFFERTHPNWFANMRMIKDGNIIEEEWFDSSVIEIE